jgi:hypothetical protein
MNHPLRCRGGALQGHVVLSRGAVRAVCYCKDCQAYARFLRSPGVVDQDGGTEVVASIPKCVHLTGGLEVLACISLRERGLLRWYASCCHTPIANTPRNPKLPYVGVVHSCLESGSPSIEASFGRLRMAVNTGSARRRVRSTPMVTAVRLPALMLSLLGARLRGAFRSNPFFVPGSSVPIRQPRVLSDAEREQAYGADA